MHLHTDLSPSLSMKSISLARPQLLNALWALHDVKGYLDDEDVGHLSTLFNVSAIEIEGVISFYHFFHRQPVGNHSIYLNNSIVSQFSGFEEVKAAFEHETGAKAGKTDPSGMFSFFTTSCIGLSDQEPAALIDFFPFTELTPQKVKRTIAKLRTGSLAKDICDIPQDNIRYKPEPDRIFLLRDHEPGKVIGKLKDLEPTQVYELLGKAGLMGMGGAFFPVGLKWELCRKNHSNRKYVVCNADEGEPGTFKDRVLLNTLPGLVIEGMVLAAYAVGASDGIIYLRAEYRYLKNKIEQILNTFREQGILGDNISAKLPFSFDIRVQLGAGAYVVGEETALLNSMEGLRGEPRTKLYFPVERGYLNKPTVVNNVETYACAARIIEFGPEKMLSLGTKNCPGTKLISISGDVGKPGIYEIEWGMVLGDLLNLCEAKNTNYIQVSGPSGSSVSWKEFNRRICREDLPCGGSFMVFNRERDILDILLNFSSFFMHESCGVCTPCRAGNFILHRKLEKLKLGMGTLRDLSDLRQWCKSIKKTSRCGLGQMSPNPILDTLKKFPEYFDQRVDRSGSRLNQGFNLEAAEEEYNEAIA
jgi:[NiFe] hydrogenase diaphorase moiety large subunit